MAGLHAVTVPVLTRYLAQLDGMMARLAAFALREGRDEAELLRAALTEGMFDLRHQALIASGFALRTLQGVAPELGALRDRDAVTIADLRAVIAEREAALAALDPDVIDAAEGVVVGETAGEARVETDALTFATHYALPNFFFHLVTVYAILRQIGVPLGKADFDGFHAYPEGFSFV